MAGNSGRRGAVRKPGTKKGPKVGSGGQRRRGLEGKGPTPKAEDRVYHPAAKRKAAAQASDAASKGRAGAPSRGRPAAQGSDAVSQGRPGAPARGRSSAQASDAASRGRPGAATRGRPGAVTRGRPGVGRSPQRGRPVSAAELVIGRNSVAEALRAQIPATTLWVASTIDPDDRVREAVRLAHEQGIAVLEATKTELDRRTDQRVHQGLVLQVPPYQYAVPLDLLDAATASGAPALIVALDSVTDPHNLGAVLRSAGAFGADGVVVPTRRSAGVTATAWKVSAGAAARVPVAKAPNLVRALTDYQQAGCVVVGLDGKATSDIGSLGIADQPTVVVVGSEGSGLTRLVRQTCDMLAAIPIQTSTESLNAAVAAGIALYELAKQRRLS